MPSSADGPESSVGSGSCLNQELLPLNFESPTFIVPLDASGGSVFRIMTGQAMLD